MKRINQKYQSVLEVILEILIGIEPARYEFGPVEEQLYGSFQPIVSMINDGLNTFKPYKSWYDFIKDVLQPFRGAYNIMKGLTLGVIATIPILLYFTIRGILLLVEKILNLVNLKVISFGSLADEELFLLGICIGSFIDGALKLVRGVTQILTTPLTWCLRIPLRGFLTARYGTPDLFDNENINDLLKRSQRDEYNVFRSDKRYILKRLHYQFKKAVNRGQETYFIKSKQKKENLLKMEEELYRNANKELDELFRFANKESKSRQQYFDFFANKGQIIEEKQTTSKPVTLMNGLN